MKVSLNGCLVILDFESPITITLSEKYRTPTIARRIAEHIAMKLGLESDSPENAHEWRTVSFQKAARKNAAKGRVKRMQAKKPRFKVNHV